MKSRGDAIPFYKFGRKPPVQKIIELYETMLRSSIVNLKEIETVN
jgi:hypothetical protein